MVSTIWGSYSAFPCIFPIYRRYTYYWASLVAHMVKNLPVIWETWVRSLGREDPLEEGMATHSSILAWRIPMDREASQVTVHRVAKSRTWLSNWAHTQKPNHQLTGGYGKIKEWHLSKDIITPYAYAPNKILKIQKTINDKCERKKKFKSILTFQHCSLSKIPCATIKP